MTNGAGAPEKYPTIFRQSDGVAVGRLTPAGTLEIPLATRWIRLGWTTPDGFVFSELEPGPAPCGWVVNGVGYRAGSPDDPVVLVTPSGVIRKADGEVTGTVDPPDRLAGAALFLALSQ
jgi:hypothetical protein